MVKYEIIWYNLSPIPVIKNIFHYEISEFPSKSADLEFRAPTYVFIIFNIKGNFGSKTFIYAIGIIHTIDI